MAAKKPIVNDLMKQPAEGTERPFAISAMGIKPWFPTPPPQPKITHRDPELLKRMKKVKCLDMGCDKYARSDPHYDWKAGRKKEVYNQRVISGHDMGGLPVVFCGSCQRYANPVDLGMMKEAEALEIIEEVRNERAKL